MYKRLCVYLVLLCGLLLWTSTEQQHAIAVQDELIHIFSQDPDCMHFPR
jgi:hypothetical protein